MPRLRLKLLLLLAGLALPSSAQPRTPSPQLVGYFGQWGAYDGIFPADLVHSGAAPLLSQLLYAQGFVTGGHCSVADPKADLNLTFTASNSVDGRPDPAAAPFHGNLRQLILLKRRYPHLKILISLEGQAHDFAADAQPAARAAFVQSCVDLFLRGNFVPTTPQPTVPATSLSTPQPPPPVISTEAKRSGETPVLAPAPARVSRHLRQANYQLTQAAKTLFDGIDIDWEYPHAEDAANFLALLTDLRHGMDSVRPGLLLTIAVGPSPRMYPGADLPAIARVVNQVGVMNYDYNGPWNRTTGLIAPLRTPDDGHHGGSVERTLTAYTDAGIPPSKLLMGLPFYGYGWHSVGHPTPPASQAASPQATPTLTTPTPATSPQPGTNQPGTNQPAPPNPATAPGTTAPPAAARNPAKPAPDPGTPGLYQPADPLRGDRPFRFFAPLLAHATPPTLLPAAGPTSDPATTIFHLYRDPLSQAPYLFNGDTLYTFEDPTSLATKATFARQHHLAGLMIWELGNDTPTATLLHATHHALTHP